MNMFVGDVIPRSGFIVANDQPTRDTGGKPVVELVRGIGYRLRGYASTKKMAADVLVCREDDIDVIEGVVSNTDMSDMIRDTVIYRYRYQH